MTDWVVGTGTGIAIGRGSDTGHGKGTGKDRRDKRGRRDVAARSVRGRGTNTSPQVSSFKLPQHLNADGGVNTGW